VTKIFVDYF